MQKITNYAKFKKKTKPEDIKIKQKAKIRQNVKERKAKEFFDRRINGKA